MIPERTQWLLHADIDGELGPGETAELDALVATSPELAAEREALRGLDRFLHDVPDLDPPADLAQRIVGEVRLPRRRSSRWPLSHWLRAPMAIPAATFAAGFLVAVGAFWSLPQDPAHHDANGMVGSIVQDLSPAGVVPRDRLRLDEAGLRGEVTLGDAAGGMRIVEFRLNSTDPVEISLDLDGSGLAFGSFAQLEAGVDLVASAGNQVLLRSQGQQYFAVFLRPVKSGDREQLHVGVALPGEDTPAFEGILESQ